MHTPETCPSSPTPGRQDIDLSHVSLTGAWLLFGLRKARNGLIREKGDAIMGTWIAIVGAVFILVLAAIVVAAIYGLGQHGKDWWHDR